MKIVIDIPKEFIENWNKDRFADSLIRMGVDANSSEGLSGNYESELCDMLVNAFEEAKEVPSGRLINAEALMDLIREHSYPLTDHFNSTDNGMFTIGIQQAVDESPTIIEKEE